jgi:hypothetical protein
MNPRMPCFSNIWCVVFGLKERGKVKSLNANTVNAFKNLVCEMFLCVTR